MQIVEGFATTTYCVVSCISKTTDGPGRIGWLTVSEDIGCKERSNTTARERSPHGRGGAMKGTKRIWSRFASLLFPSPSLYSSSLSSLSLPYLSILPLACTGGVRFSSRAGWLPQVFDWIQHVKYSGLRLERVMVRLRLVTGQSVSRGSAGTCTPCSVPPLSCCQYCSRISRLSI